MLILRTARETSRSCEPNYIDFVFRILPHNYQFVYIVGWDFSPTFMVVYLDNMLD